MLTAVIAEELMTKYAAPAYVQYAQADAALPTHVFADTQNRKFACDTASNTWLAAAEYFDTSIDTPTSHRHAIEDRLFKAAQFQGIEKDIFAIVQTVSQIKTANAKPLTADDYLLHRDVDGQLVGHYPVTNADEVKTAADYFCQYRAEMDFNTRQTFARRLLKTAEKLDVSIADPAIDLLTRTAGHGVTSTSIVKTAIEQRLANANYKFAGTTTNLTALFDVLANDPTQLHIAGVPQKIASTLAQYDELHGLQHRYTRDIAFPEDVCFAVTEKVAHEVRQSVVSLPNGNVYALQDIQEIPPAHWALWVGNKFASELTGPYLIDQAQFHTKLAACSEAEQRAVQAAISAANVPVRWVAKTATSRDAQRANAAAAYQLATLTG